MNDNPGTDEPDQPRPLTTRLAWFISLWALGVVSVGAIAYGLKLWIA